jgi:glutathione synthase/RimK-type ligase-like ATP-grasp enzyme
MSAAQGASPLVMTVLTTRPAHPMLRALAAAAERHAVLVRCSSRVDARSSLVFAWSFPRPAALTIVREFCEHHRIDHVNAEPVGKWEQLVRLSDAGLPIPNSRRAVTPEDARSAAALIGYPVIIKPNWGLRSQGVELVPDEAALELAWTHGYRVVQSYLAEGARCTRVLVIGGRAVSAVTRVALDGVHATYDHGRRGTLEAYPISPECEALAVAACRAVGVGVGGVDIVDTAAGPCVLEVNHVRVDFGDRDLHGPDAVPTLAAWLAERAQARARRVDLRARPRRVRIVTGVPGHPAVGWIKAACAAHGFAADVAATIDATADATWFWGGSAVRRRRALAQAAALPAPVIGGNRRGAAANRALLFRAGISVPRWRTARTVNAALRVASEFGYPVTLYAAGSRRPRQVAAPDELRAAWPGLAGSGCLIEPAHYAAAPRIRVWVAGDRAFRAMRRARGRWSSMPLRRAPCELAIASCRALNIDLGIVDLACVEGSHTVLRAVCDGAWITELTETAARVALTGIAAALRERLDAPRPEAARRRTGSPRLTVVMARDYEARGSGHRTGNIRALYRELVLRGHRMVELDGRLDRHLLDDADFILQDPLHAFGLGRSRDELDRFLYEHAATRCHLLRHMREGTVDKHAMHRLAMSLGVSAPALYRPSDVSAKVLPIVAKPRCSSLGIGVRLVRTMDEFRALRPSRLILQQYVDSGTARAVSLRAVTVVDRVVAAAVFHNEGSVCSNLAQGGRAIPLTGPGRNLHLTRAELALLERIGIDPGRRGVPTAVAEMAAAIGRHHSRNGAQMTGQDFVVDEQCSWYFLEANMGFGTAVFNSTDGEGYPSNGRGFAHAGRVLADAVEAQFTREGRSDA